MEPDSLLHADATYRYRSTAASYPRFACRYVSRRSATGVSLASTRRS